MIDVTDALQHVNLASRDEVYHTCRALLVHRHDQLAVFDRAFDMFWRTHTGRSTARTGCDEAGGRQSWSPDSRRAGWRTASVDPADEGASSPALLQTWSDVGATRREGLR